MSASLVGPFAPTKGSPLPLGTRWHLSVDPGRHTGWALWRPGSHELVACGVGCPPLTSCCKMAIELPQVYPHSPVPPNDLITLAFLAGRYVGAFREAALGRESMFITPHAWKGNLPKNVCENRVRMRLTATELKVTHEAEGVIPKSQWHDLWDSVGIGLVCFRGVKL